MHRFVIGGTALILASCASSPPKPPTADHSTPTAINTVEKALMLTLRAELAEARGAYTGLRKAAH